MLGKMFQRTGRIGGEIGERRRASASRDSSMVIKIKLFTVFCFATLAALLVANLFSSPVTGNAHDLQMSLSGAELFENNCARCHGSDGKGGKGPNLASEKRQAKWKESDEKLVKKITRGGFLMPSFGKKLKAGEIQSIADHVRTLKE